VDRLRESSVSEGTGAHRLELWYYGWQMLLSNPLLGVGMHNYPEYAGGFVAHNSLVHVMAETGLTGLFIWIGLFYFSFKSLINTRAKVRNKNEPNRISMLVDSLQASLIGFLATAFFLSRAYEYLPYILIALSIAICYSLESVDYSQGNRNGCRAVSSAESKYLKFSGKDLVNILGLEFGFLVFLFGILKMFA
jgi:O-antigen ligase